MLAEGGIPGVPGGIAAASVPFIGPICGYARIRGPEGRRRAAAATGVAGRSKAVYGRISRPERAFRSRVAGEGRQTPEKSEGPTFGRAFRV